MKYASVLSAALDGINAHIITVEADYQRGPASMYLIGLPDKAVDESRERVRSALVHSGFSMPRQRLTINLAPASMPKQGGAFDVAIALSILITSGQITVNETRPSNIVFLGELALDGSLRPIRGGVALVADLVTQGCTNFFVPKANQAEAAAVKQACVYGVDKLSDIISFLEGKSELVPVKIDNLTVRKTDSTNFFGSIRGQAKAKRALTIALAGGHNLCLVGSPGSGKSMLAKAARELLPPLTEDEAIAVTKLHSVAGLLPPHHGLITERPWRSPHHSASAVSVIGGGRYPKPGEISLAHHGILFLDEFPEFPRAVLENLRQPLEDKTISIARVGGRVTFPAHIMLLAAMNPCPCGYYFDEDTPCVCSENARQRYMKKVSGPILDRIDLIVKVQKVETETLVASNYKKECADQVAQQIAMARSQQSKRYESHGIQTNAQMSNHNIETFCVLKPKTRLLMKQATEKLQLSGRGYFRLLKVTRTIADLAHADNIESEHIMEALQYRDTLLV